MFQHYKSGQRSGSLAAYNDLRWQIEEWSKDKNLADYYIWPQVEHELEDHCPLAVYLSEPQNKDNLKKSCKDAVFKSANFGFHQRASKMLRD